jgi:hypothetical protein
MKSVLLLLCFIFLLSAKSARSSELPSVTHYSLDAKFLLKEEQMSARAEMAVVNKTGKPISEVPFLLYRLLEVKSATDDKSESLSFVQAIVRDADSPQLQVNLVRVHLKQPLKPGDSTKIALRYEGFIYGYPEVMAYVRESITEQYAFLRQETFSYPIIALPNERSRIASYSSIFTYDLRVTAPTGYTVATGGKLTETSPDSGFTTFVFKSKIPIGQIDIAVAKFFVKKDEQAGLTVYALPGHEAGADRVLKGIKGVIAFYSHLFGEISNYQGYTVIEIPEDWGSQAPPLYILQTAAVFEDPKKMVELYHEVGHTWNAKVKPEVQRSRYFDEAFASYFAALALREFEGKEAFENTLEEARKSFMRRVEKDRRNYETPIADYGKYEMGGLSYTKGAWSLYVLHQVLGDEAFYKVMRAFLADYSQRGADFKAFQQTAERVSSRNLSKFFAEWIYGTESSRLLTENRSITEIVSRYS